MAVLVGRYLVQTGSTGNADGGRPIWTGSWTINESPTGSGLDWKAIHHRQTKQGFLTASGASIAAEQQGIVHARELQNDHTLEPLEWRVPFPLVPN